MTTPPATTAASAARSGLAGSFLRLPRALRWLIYTALVIVAYFAIVEPALDARARFDSRADALQRDLAELRAYTGADSDAGVSREVVLESYGAPAPPAAPGEVGRPADFEAAVNEIFRAHAVRKDQTERRSVINVPQEAGIIGEDQTLQRQELTLTFEATPRTVARIVADLEAEPLVTSVTRLRLDKAAARRSDSGQSGLVKATIGVETWMIIGGARAGGGAVAMGAAR